MFLQDWILKDEGESSFWAPLLRNFCFLNFHFFSGLFVSHDSNIFLETNSILKILRVTNFRFCCVTTIHIFFFTTSVIFIDPVMWSKMSNFLQVESVEWAI